MAELYTPEQITRRNKEIECQLSKNISIVAGSNRTKLLFFIMLASGDEMGSGSVANARLRSFASYRLPALASTEVMRKINVGLSNIRMCIC